MPKRKRDTDTAQDDARVNKRQRHVDDRINNGLARLARAVKIAKGNERQKLGRREKTAKRAKKDKDIVRIAAEIVALKSVEDSACASLLLHKSLSKIKAVTDSTFFASFLSSSPPQSNELAALNVHARLCNSTRVKKALRPVIEELLYAADIHSEKKSNSNKKLKTQPSRKEQDNHDASVERGLSGDDIGPGSGDESEDFAQLDDMVAGSDDESRDGEEESNNDDVADLERQLEAEGVTRDEWSGSEDDVNDDIELADDMSDDDNVSLAESTHKAAIHSKSNPSSSMLLPSLTMGGYISGSDGTDIEDIDIAPKKNRPGQRARQANWEKKYGHQAKHLQDSKKTRDMGWDMKRGATGNGTKGAYRSSSGRPHIRQEAPVPVKPKKDDSGALHPSWEAAKRAKAQKAATVAFTGKKVAFD